MLKRTLRYFALIILFHLILNHNVFGRAAFEKNHYSGKASIAPVYCIVAHRIGNIELAVANNGTLGTFYSNTENADFFTGESIDPSEYPINSGIGHMFTAAFWIGAVVDEDTLVSVTADGWSLVQEFIPDAAPFGYIKKKSILNPDLKELYEGAVSEEDYIMQYADTATSGLLQDGTDGRPHRPLNVEIIQKSYAWSYPYADDFVLFDYGIQNIGTKILEDVYMGIYCDPDVQLIDPASGHFDDICGFVETVHTNFNGCDYVDTINLAWFADNDGDPKDGGFNQLSPTSAAGLKIIRTPQDSLDVSFNWWISSGGSNLDFGPREKSYVGRLKEKFRDFGTGGLGTPEGDRNKYYQLSNREFDYDQFRAGAISPTDTLWLRPNPDYASDYADGYDTRFLISFGPFRIKPGEILPISFAYVGGDNFHTEADNIDNLPHAPESYYANLNFKNLAENSNWAKRVYDNPGVDTDGDNYFGKIRSCCLDSTFLYTDTIPDGDSTIIKDIYNFTGCDTVFYEGDGVPDFRGAAPPPAPKLWLEPINNGVRIRFNGLNSETTKDIFTHLNDFEGYRIYIGRDERASSYSIVASYDRENYNKYVWDERLLPYPGFVLREFPYDIKTLRCLYGDSCGDLSFDPSLYTRANPYVHPLFPESTFYFVPQDFNVSELGVTSPITKIYPKQSYPSSLIPDSAQTEELTEDGYLKYFEYEYTITDLLPTVPYFVNVTALDFGNPVSGLKSLESSVSTNAKMFYPLSPSNDLSMNKKVYIWPNPYRIDGKYRSSSFEGRNEVDRHDDRIRAVHFGNLPAKCTISIYSIDGDLIKQFEHETDPDSPTSSHDQWDLITRNTQLVTSGFYYWVVEAENFETQIGKLVVIM